MSRNAETKTYGSIRKVKHYGACGVILGVADIGADFFCVNLIADEYEGNKICEYIVRSVVINYVSEKLEKYMEKNQLENEATFYNLFNLFEKYNTEIYEQAMEFMSIHDEKGYEKYGANSYLLKQYFDKNCYQPSDNLLRKIENLTN